MGLVWTADEDKKRITIEYDGIITSHEINNISQALQDPTIDGFTLLVDFTRVDAKQVAHTELASEIQTQVALLMERKIARMAHVASNADQDHLLGFFIAIKELVPGNEVIQVGKFSDLPAANNWLDEKQ